MKQINKITKDGEQYILSAKANKIPFNNTTLEDYEFEKTIENSVPKNHAAAADTYGAAGSDLYGHIKITDDILKIEDGVLSIQYVDETHNGVFNVEDAKKTIGGIAAIKEWLDDETD